MHTRLLLLAGLLCPLTATAQHLGIAPHAGTLGIGLDAAVRVAAPLNLRVGGNYFALNRTFDTTIEDLKVTLDGDVQLLSATAFLDYHPFGGRFRLTGGLLYNDNTFDASGRPDQPSYTSGNVTLTQDEVGTISGSVHFPALNPYAGIGIGNVASGRGRFGFMLDVGALYQGPPSFAMDCTGAVTPTCEQAGDIEQKMDGYRVYPVLSLGFVIRLLR